MNCPHCSSQQFKIHQKNGHTLSTMYRCVLCRGFFSERRFTGYSGLKLTTESFMCDLAGRLLNRPQITSDGLRAYAWAVETAFGSEVDFGMLIKSYAERDGRLELTGAQPRPMIGRPKIEHISTSYAERNN